MSFDLDGTLYDYGLCHHEALKYTAQVAKINLGLDNQEFNEFYDKSRHIIHQRLSGTASSHSRLLYFNELVFNFTKKSFIPVVTLLERTYWNAFYQAMHIYPGVLPLLKELRLKSIKLALVTDMTADIQFEKIKRLKLTNMFDVIVTSEEAGCEKPDPIIFEICLTKMNIKADSAIHIGDDYQRDVVGAKAAGLDPILFVPENKTAYIFNDIKTVHSFRELARILIPKY